MFSKLCDGSENHLGAFVTVYEKTTDEVHEPRWLTQEAHGAILAGAPDQDGGQHHDGRT